MFKLSKRIKNFLLIMSIVAILGFIVMFPSMQRAAEEQRLTEYLYQNTITRDNVDFSTIMTQFDWDKLYIFPPYTSVERLKNTLPFWSDYHLYSTIPISETYSLFVFVKNDHVIDALTGPAHFANCYRDIGYIPGEARFQRDNDGYMKWVGEIK